MRSTSLPLAQGWRWCQNTKLLLVDKKKMVARGLPTIRSIKANQSSTSFWRHRNSCARGGRLALRITSLCYSQEAARTVCHSDTFKWFATSITIEWYGISEQHKLQWLFHWEKPMKYSNKKRTIDKWCLSLRLLVTYDKSFHIPSAKQAVASLCEMTLKTKKMWTLKYKYADSNSPTSDYVCVTPFKCKGSWC